MSKKHLFILGAGASASLLPNGFPVGKELISNIIEYKKKSIYAFVSHILATVVFRNDELAELIYTNLNRYFPSLEDMQQYKSSIDEIISYIKLNEMVVVEVISRAEFDNKPEKVDNTVFYDEENELFYLYKNNRPSELNFKADVSQELQSKLLTDIKNHKKIPCDDLSKLFDKYNYGINGTCSELFDDVPFPAKILKLFCVIIFLWKKQRGLSQKSPISSMSGQDYTDSPGNRQAYAEFLNDLGKYDNFFSILSHELDTFISFFIPGHNLQDSGIQINNYVEMIINKFNNIFVWCYIYEAQKVTELEATFKHLLSIYMLADIIERYQPISIDYFMNNFNCLVGYEKLTESLKYRFFNSSILSPALYYRLNLLSIIVSENITYDGDIGKVSDNNFISRLLIFSVDPQKMEAREQFVLNVDKKFIYCDKKSNSVKYVELSEELKTRFQSGSGLEGVPYYINGSHQIVEFPEEMPINPVVYIIASEKFELVLPQKLQLGDEVIFDQAPKKVDTDKLYQISDNKFIFFDRLSQEYFCLGKESFDINTLEILEIDLKTFSGFEHIRKNYYIPTKDELEKYCKFLVSDILLYKQSFVCNSIMQSDDFAYHQKELAKIGLNFTANDEIKKKNVLSLIKDYPYFNEVAFELLPDTFYLWNLILSCNRIKLENNYLKTMIYSLIVNASKDQSYQDNLAKYFIDNVKVITFNYDRTFEILLAYYLFADMRNEDNDKIWQDSISHVYGEINCKNASRHNELFNKLVKIENNNRSSNYNINDIFDQCQSISWIRDATKEGENRKKYHKWYTDSDNVYIFGFSFDENNLEKLGMDEYWTCDDKKKNIYISKGDPRIHQIIKRLYRIDNTNIENINNKVTIMLKPGDHPVKIMISENYVSEALSSDFDLI